MHWKTYLIKVIFSFSRSNFSKTGIASKSDPEKIEAVWVVFKDHNVGKLLRYELKNLKKLHKQCNDNGVPILRQKKASSIQNGEIKFQRHQFPLTRSYAITAYKCQGDTLYEVIIDFTHGP